MHLTLGVFTILISFVSYGIYVRAIWRGKAKPHAFTWLIWALLNIVVAVEQVSHNAGPGAWSTMIAAGASIVIFLLTMRSGSHSIRRLDVVCLITALVALYIHATATSSEVVVALAALVFAIGFIPTFRKAYRTPHKEKMITFALNGTKFMLAIFALSSVTFVTAVYPITLMVLNYTFVIFLLFRRRTTRPGLREYVHKLLRR